MKIVATAQDITELTEAQDALACSSNELGRYAAELRDHASQDDRLHASHTTAELTARQREVLALVSEGLCNKAIAKRLVVSEATIKSHLREILRRLHAANRTEAVARYLQNAT